MTRKATLFAAASALLLSAGAAAAFPAIAESPLRLRAGPGFHFPVVGVVPPGATVNVRGCGRGWCRLRFAGEAGFARRSQLAMRGGAAVAVAPGYVYDDDYYYDYGPSVGIYAGVGGRFHHGWRDRHWQNGGSRWSGGGSWAGHGGNWSGRTSGGTAGTVTPRQGFAGPPASWQRPGTGIGGGGMAGASVGMRGGGHAPAGGGAHAGGGAAPGGGAGSGFAGSIAKH